MNLHKIVFFLPTKTSTSDTEGKYASFLDQFGNDVESFSKKKFLSHSKKLVEHWRRNKYHLNKKNILLSHSRENWNALSEEDKKLHSLIPDVYLRRLQTQGNIFVI